MFMFIVVHIYVHKLCLCAHKLCLCYINCVYVHINIEQSLCYFCANGVPELGLKLFVVLNISVISNCTFSWCIVTDLSVSNNDTKLEV